MMHFRKTQEHAPPLPCFPSHPPSHNTQLLLSHTPRATVAHPPTSWLLAYTDANTATNTSKFSCRLLDARGLQVRSSQISIHQTQKDARNWSNLPTPRPRAKPQTSHVGLRQRSLSQLHQPLLCTFRTLAAPSNFLGLKCPCVMQSTQPQHKRSIAPLASRECMHALSDMAFWNNQPSKHQRKRASSQRQTAGRA